jgi:hypothetical protein
MSEKTVVYEGPDGTETAHVETLDYDEHTENWRFKREREDRVETIQLPRERVYRIVHTQEVEQREGRDEYGHP